MTLLTSWSRLSFVERDILIKELEAFRRSRIAQCRPPSEKRESPGPAAFCFHVLPVGSLSKVRPLDALAESLRSREPFDGRLGWQRRYNADGYVSQERREHGEPTKHVQWFRFGGIEAFCSDLVTMRSDLVQTRVPTLATQMLAQIVLRGVVDSIEVVRSILGVSVPLALSAVLVRWL